MSTKGVIMVLAVLLGWTRLSAQEDRKEVCIGFRIGSSYLEEAFQNNSEQLAEIVGFLENLQNDESLELVEVSFCGSASPDGSVNINKKLSRERRDALANYIRERVELPDSIISYNESVFAWERLASLVAQSEMPYKEEAVDVILNVPEYTYNEFGALVDSKKKHLMELQYGRTWNYMYRNFFPAIRSSSVIFVTVRQKEEVIQEQVPDAGPVRTEEPVTVASAADTAAVSDTCVMDAGGLEVTGQDTVRDDRKPFYMALKTNMLYDVAAVPNIGVEFYLGKNWSVSASWEYAWWNSTKRNRFWRIYGGDLAVRKWFGKKAKEKPLTGHHLGIYGHLFTYDFEWGGKGVMGGEPGAALWQSPNYAVGLEYGYSLPIARRLNIDFSIGAGYWGGVYYNYIPLDEHYVWKSTVRRNWFGPTKAEVSLVWLLGRNNTNSKGGVR